MMVGLGGADPFVIKEFIIRSPNRNAAFIADVSIRASHSLNDKRFFDF